MDNQRVNGNQFPAYLNGRPRTMLIEAFAPTAPVFKPSLAVEFRNAGVQIGEGVPFATLYMTRAKKKLAVLRTAA